VAMGTEAVARAASISRARLAQALTVGWMTVEGLVGIGAGIAAHSVALTAFGVDSVIELVSAALVFRWLLSKGAQAGSRGRLERRTTRAVGIALYCLIVYIVGSSLFAAFSSSRPGPTPVGVILTTASLAIMFGLWRWRLALADQLQSSALRADAACSAVCIYMAAAALVGLLLNQLLGWWWADVAAGLALIYWIRGEAAEAIEAASG
jgi:divalent metal cation (Fe/Co/Zn/Cd) transporter